MSFSWKAVPSLTLGRLEFYCSLPITDSRAHLLTVGYCADTVLKKERTFQMVSGKAMGGTSNINALLYTRSTPGEYNAWARDGRKGWSYDEVEPYFNSLCPTGSPRIEARMVSNTLNC